MPFWDVEYMGVFMKEKMYDLTAPQKSILLTEQYFKGSCVNNVCGTAIIDEKIDFDLLEKAVNLVVKNNSSFRIRLILENNEVRQYVSEYEPFRVPTIDVETVEDVSKIENDLMAQVFDIYSNLCAFRLFRFPDGKGGFMINIHHIISDSWTLGLFAREVVRSYSSLTKKEEPDFSTVSSYTDYIKSEQDYISSEKFIKDKEYWNSIFETIPEQASIAGSKTNLEDSFSCKANRSSFSIDKSLMDKINDFCKSAHISVFNFFMAVYSIYIGRVSNLDDFVIGTPILNRTNFKEKNTTGMFINTAPIRINLSDEMDFKSFVDKIAKDSLGMLRHQKYSYQYILDDLRKENPNLPNLYNILISYQVTKANAEDSLSYETRWAFNGNCNDDIDIHLYDLNATGCIDIAYDYRNYKYTENDIIAIHNRILHMINQIINNASINLSNIEIVTSKEKYDILYNFNNTDLEYDENVPFISYFEEQVKRHPHDTAITFHEQNMNYETLNQKANSLAYYLRENGINNNSVVGIMVNRSFEMMIAILAVLKSGGAYIPIDPDYPDNRINYMIEDSKMHILLTQRTLKKDINCNNIIYIDLQEDFYINHTQNIDLISKPNDLSYLIYTSGSTGLPKGVMLTQKSLVNFYHAMKQKISYLSDNKIYRVLSITTVSFDIFAFETLISLANGLHLYMSDNFEQKSTQHLENLISKHGIEIMQTTPSVMRFHLDNLEKEENFSNLKYVMLAGEQLPLDLVTRIKMIAPNCIVYNGYGPSETTIFSSVQDVTNLEKINIGKPIANTQFYILDKHQNLLPKHHIGEIYIAGNGLGNGYLFKPDLTSKNFLQNPFSSNSLLYKTGDLGLWLDNGCIECKGRSDHQVKLRGLRIELGEIESKIHSYQPSIKCAVTVRNENGTDYLYAFIESKEKVDINNLRIFLTSCLPNYMVPSYFVILDKLPQTPNGKTDKKALKTYPVSNNATNINKTLPKNEVEQFLYDSISNLVHHSNFGVEDDFYSIGMDSLNIILLSGYIEKQYQISFSIKDLYSVASITDLASLILNSAKSTEFKINMAPVNDSYPLTQEQLSIFYAIKMSQEDTLLYNVSGGVVLDSILDKEKVENSFKKIIERHSSFRTCFQFMDQEPRQIVLDVVPFSVETFYGNSSCINDIISNFPKPFSLENAPLLRVALCFLENRKTLLLLDTHHIIMDGSSLNIVLKDFCSLYNDDKELEKNNLRYIDFAIWEQNYLQSSFAALHRDYWNHKLNSKEFPTLALPYDYSPTSTISYEGDMLHSTISEDIFLKIETIAKQEGVSTYTMFLAIFYLLLYHYTSQENILIGTPLANRSSQSLQDVVGMFVNNVVLDVCINSNLTFCEFLHQVKNVVLDAMEHQPYPYYSLVKDLNINGKNLFDVMFVYQNEHKSDFCIDGSNLEFLYANTHTSKFNLSFEVLPHTRTVQLEYRTNLFKKETVTSFLEHYLYLLENISNYLTKKISNFDILLEKEKDIILNTFNNTFLPYNKNKDMVSLLQEYAENTPQKTAIIFEDQPLSYDILNKKSNSLAYYLSTLNIQKDDTVSIILNRSFDLIIAIYAVLKCGASYVLIDPSFPKDRINYILKDSHSKYCITNTDLASLSSISCIKIDLFDFNTNSSANIYNPSDNLCIIYTSGSTGTPKGVVLHKHGFVNLLYAFDKEMNISTYSNILGIATVSFDMFCVELFSSLFYGNTLILANEEEQKNIVAMSNLIKEYNVEFFVTTPSRVELLLLDECNNPLKNVKAFQLGGEKFTPALYEKLRKVTNAKIYNGYGPTEITACCSNKLINSSDITIGKPIGNVQIYICNSNMNLCPIGVVGEICVAGHGVSNGYLNNNEVTSKSFIKNPFGNGLLYKTGDLGKLLPNGEIAYIGRSDFQIKIRGLRIELSEIEAKLNALNSIENSAILYKDDNNFSYLIAFVVSKDTINVHTIKSELSKVLPAYMIPRYIIQLEQLPITLNGKIDKKTLAQHKLSTDTFENRNDYTPPETEKQKLFCEIWSSLLNIDIGIDDDLFDIGADSLLAIRFKTQLLAYDIDLPYSDIFQYRTIRELCNVHTPNIDKKDSLNLFNYTDINYLLNNQTNSIMKYRDNHNILLLGSTGFVGMHIIDSFIKNSSGKIYCIVREKNKISAMCRFMDLLHFYFGKRLDSLIDKRIFVLKGNIVKEHFGLSNQNYQLLADNVDTVINSAANVKHFGNVENFKNINVDSLKIATDFCLNFKKRFIHISSLSISGNMILDGYTSNLSFLQKTFNEQDLFIGQTLDNVYSRSKFDAERMILEQIIHNGLNAQILRLGNITSRYSDGKFQFNPDDNAFANRLKSFLMLKALPDYLLKDYIEFTPVDLCADAIIKIINYECSHQYIYHIYNDNHVYFTDFIKFLKEYGIYINILSEKDFSETINSVLSNKTSANSLSGIINDFSGNKKLDYSSYVNITGESSKEFLKSCNFIWPKIDFAYIKKYIDYLKKIKFID